MFKNSTREEDERMSSLVVDERRVTMMVIKTSHRMMERISYTRECLKAKMSQTHAGQDKMKGTRKS